MYGFKKIKEIHEIHEFQHCSFKRGFRYNYKNTFRNELI